MDAEEKRLERARTPRLRGWLSLLANVSDEESPLASGVLPARAAGSAGSMTEVPKGRGFAPSPRWDYLYSRGRTYFSKAVEPIPAPKETSANRNEKIRLLAVASDRNIRPVKKRRKTNAIRLLHVSAVTVVTIPRACDLDPGAVRLTIPATTKSANSGIL
jgi:hypothetical protein